MPSRAPSLVRLERSPLTHLIARVLVLTLLSWSLPFDAALPRRAAAREAAPVPPPAVVAGQQPAVLYVDGNAGAACGGRTPCFTTIQGAIDAVGPGQRIEIAAGTYVEQLDIKHKNAGASAREADRIVIEADPASPPGSVVLGGRGGLCESGYAVDIAHSKYVTLRGLTIVGAGGRGVGLRGGSAGNTGINLERNRVGRGGTGECNGGIDVGRGNPQTVIANNLIHGNGRNGIRFRDGRGGSYYVVGNTIVRSGWSGIQIAHAAAVEIVNNVIVANGTAPGAARARVGIRRLKTNPSPASQVRMLGNLVCGNRGGELAGPLLDATDAGNRTPTGAEGPGVAASAACGDLTSLFADPDGEDGITDTADDDFHLIAGAPAIDAGVDPRPLGYPLSSAVLEADFDGEAARPRDGDGDEAAEFDAGAHESTGGVQSSPTPTRTSTATPAPTPTASAAPTAVPTDAPTATPPPTPEPTATAAPTIAPTAAPTASPEPTAEPTPTSPPEPCLQCAACDTGLAGICSAGRTFCDGPFAEPECRTTTEPRSEACGNRVDEDCDGVADEGGLPETLPTGPPRTGVFVEPLGTPLTFGNGGSAVGLAQGDFDRDGRLDLAVTQDVNVPGVGGRRYLSILLGDGGGGFAAPQNLDFPPNVSVNAVLAHDFDRDGEVDLLVAWFELRQVAFYRGNGDGTFAAPVASDVSIRVSQIQTADVDCDGVLDVASIGEGTSLTVSIGNGDGTFGTPTSYVFNNNLVDLAFADVNGDGHPDLVTGSHEYAPTTGIGVRLNDVAGHFGDLIHTSGFTLPDRFGNRAQGQVFGIQIADFDGDGMADAVASTQGPLGCFMFMKGNGDGTFAPADYFDGIADLDPSWTCVGGSNFGRRYTENVAPDVNADGKPDVLFTYFSDDNRVVIGLGRGDGRFDAGVYAASAGVGVPPSASNPRADGAGVAGAVVGDVNGDCMLDLVTSGFGTNASQGRMGVLLARAPGDFHAPRIAPLLRDPSGDNGHQTDRGVTVGDFDNDGNPDFAAGVGRAFFTVPGFGIGIDVFAGDGTGRGHALPFTLNNYAGTGASFLRAADFDQDGFLDLVFQGGDGPFGRRQSVSTVFGAGDFTFGDRQSAWSPRLDADQTNIRNLIVADLDGDGDPDVAEIEDDGYGTRVISTFANARTRTPLQFVAEVSVGSGTGFGGRGLVAADLDGDGILDLVAQDFGTNPQRLRFFKGNGDLTFQPGVTILEMANQGAATTEDLAADDLDGDGDQDLVLAQYYHGCAYVLLGHDDGTFDAPVCYPVWSGRTNRVAIADFDVDGALDIVVGVEDGGLVFVRGHGDGTFDSGQPYAVGRHATEVVNVADFDRDGRPDLLWSFNNGNFGHSIVLSNATGAVPTPTPVPTATLPPGVTPTPTSSPSPSPTPRVTATPPANLASLVVEPADQIVLAGATQGYTATGVLADGTSVDLTGGVAWTSSAPAVASMSGTGTATGVAAGATTIGAAIGAISGSTSLSVGARVAGDSNPPVAQITSPAANAEVTAPIDVVGTATDANFLKYEIEIAPAGETTFTLLKRGAAPVANGVLGQLDPTLLINDLYTLRLTVFDRGGNQTTAQVVVQVAGDMKVGNFSLSFRDLLVAVSGVPLAINRVYDSRDKGRGDFGVGWRLDLRSLRVRSNRVLGTGWTTEQVGFNVRLVALDEHKVSVTLPSGKVEEFDLALSPTQQPFSLDATTVTGFVPRPGTVGRLEALADPDLFVIPAGAEVELTDAAIQTYDPVRYRYTTSGGVAFVVHRANGLESVTDASGNVVTIGSFGVSHSSGKAVDILRDVEGRITQITDPKGVVQTYAYDTSGNLASHTDAAGNVTRFHYDRRHGLLRIVDPLSRPTIRNEYDDAGRLIASTSASGRRVVFDHDLGARVDVVTDVDGNVSTVEYDAAGRVLRTIDPLGGVTTNTYDARGNQLTTTDALGETTTRTFDARGNKLSETDALGFTSTFTYDAKDRLLTSTNPLGQTTTLTYDARGKLLTRTNALGVVVETNGYDARGDLVSTADALGKTTLIERDPAGFATAVVNPRGGRREYRYDANGNLTGERDARGNFMSTVVDAKGDFTAKTDALGNTARFEFDVDGVLTGVTDPAGNRISQILDGEGRVASTTDPLGRTSTFEYGPSGNLLRTVDPAGRVRSYEYDALARPVRAVLEDGAFEKTAYDAVGRPLEKIDANGDSTRYEHDALGRVTKKIDALGGEYTFGYDAAGNVVQQTDPLGRTMTFEYDAAGRQTRVVYPDGTFATVVYDVVGRVVTRTDEAGRATTLAYDDNGNVVQVTEPTGATTTATYDADDNLTSRTDALGRTTGFEYDANGRRTRVFFPDGSIESSEYDAAGNVSRIVRPDGSEIVQEFDGLKRPTARELPGGRRIEYTYGASGEMASITDDRGTISFSHDVRGRVVAIDNPDGSSLAYAYDAVGNRTSVTTRASAVAALRTTSYAFDALDRLTQVTDPGGASHQYGYDAAGRLSHLQRPNGTLSQITRDLAGRPLTVEHRRGATALERFAYAYDASGDPTRIDSLDGSAVEFEYDVARRVTREVATNPAAVTVRDVRYAYDAVGNRLSETDALASLTTTYSYDVMDRALSAGGVSFAYDANGRLVGRTSGAGISEFAYDADDRLVRVTSAGGEVFDHTYDAVGNRVRTSGPGGVTNYLVDPFAESGVAQVLEETDVAGASTGSMVHGLSLLEQERSGSTTFPMVDAARNVRLLTDDAGVVTDRYAYDAFGREVATSGSTSNAFRFAGEQFDPGSGLYYLRARYYSPELGRFVSRDPVAGSLTDPASLHPYLYARNNPLSFADPSGRFSVPNNLAETMLANALISAVVSIGIDAVKGKKPWEIFSNAVLNATLGAVSGALGGLSAAGATKLIQSLGVSFATQRGVAIVTIATAKAAASTFVSMAKLIYDTSQAKSGKDIPSLGGFVILFGFTFTVNLTFELFFLGINFNADVNKASQKVLQEATPTAERVAEAFAAEPWKINPADIYRKFARSGEENFLDFIGAGDNARYVGKVLGDAGSSLQTVLAQIDAEASKLLAKRLAGAGFFKDARTFEQLFTTLKRALAKAFFTKSGSETEKVER